jgi:hypothetical protein
VRLREDAGPSAKLIVDRKAGIIRNVRVCNIGESLNGRYYSREVLENALPLYRKAPVFADHPDPKSSTPRSMLDKIGMLTNVRMDAQGVLADLLLLKSHEAAERLFEAAERMPQLFGLSHNITGEIETDDQGRTVVRRINEVESVDAVAEPSSVRGLESRQRRKRS